jgi:predicted ArsR family transcriptional regulator
MGYNKFEMSAKKTALNTRERILAHLQEYRTTTAAELSRTLSLTRADIRYHINVLIKEGRLELISKNAEQPAQRGRPTQYYRLTDSSAPGNYPNLASSLMNIIALEFSPKDQEKILLKLAITLANGFVWLPGAAQRFTRAVRHLNQMYYRARWEASAAGPRFILRSCPYAAIIDQHPEICRMDLLLLEHLTQISLEQTEKMNRISGVPPACIFLPRQ